MIISRLKQLGTSFGEKLDFAVATIPQVDEVSRVRIISVLLEEAAVTRPTLGELDALCDHSSALEILHEYLRGFFIYERHDPHRVEMAERLDEVISYRMAQKKAHHHDHKLRQTIAEYLLRSRN